MELFILFFAVIIGLAILQGSYVRKLEAWHVGLRDRTLRAHEFPELIEDMSKLKGIPNRPKYWGMAKQIYFAALHSKELSFEQKIQIYELFDRLGVQGISYPKGRPSERREATIHDIF
ncbi:hypothetical protein [Exiguobacterium sp. TNDT2]|uniref:hypothetical protein n=1 Tax=Exiguobacterium sp. TNDT2 TaxID=2233531 RepID=UPI000DEF8E86|nr:hypothetical protein [Exiguobacterium sp. TNDT2]